MNKLINNNKLAFSITAGILIFFVITQVLNFFVSRQKNNSAEELAKIARDINKKAPIILDSSRRFDGIIALPGNKLQYNYSFLTKQAKEIDTAALIKLNRNLLLEKIKANPDLAFFKKNEVDFFSHFVDKNGAYVCMFEISHLEY